MTLKIEITTTLGGECSASQQLDEALRAVGFTRDSTEIPMFVGGPQPGRASVEFEARPDVQQGTPAADTVEQPAQPNAETLATIHEKADVKPTRERGKPSPGKKRRTAEEVAEDEAAAAGAQTEDEMREQIETERAEQLAGKPQISTGEERVGPQDTLEMEAQDAADEAAEADGGAIEDMLTLDHLRAAMKDYVEAYGMAATQEDGPNILKAALGDLPAGSKNPDGSEAKAWRLSLVPDEQGSLKAAVDAWREAIAKNPWKRAAAVK